MIRFTATIRKSFVVHLISVAGVFALIFMLNRKLEAQVVYSESDSHASYATDVNGNLYVWGQDEYLHPIATTPWTSQDLLPVKMAFPSGVTRWVSVAAGYYHTLALGNDGNIYAWGYNAYGQLGDGDTLNSSTLVNVKLPTGVTATAIACGDDHSLAIGSDENVYAWGENNYGQLGNGTTTNSDVPVKVDLPGGFVPAQVAAGFYYSFAIGSDGSMYAWGFNGQGQLDLGNITNQKLPVEVPLPSGVTKWIAAYGGIYFTMAMGNDGNLYGCGYNTFGQLGDGTTNNTTTFVKVKLPPGVTGWKKAACVGSSVLAIANNDTLYSWGYDGDGEVGNGTTGLASVYPPVKVQLPAGVEAISVAGERFDCLAVGNDNYYYAWGNGSQGQLGNGGNAEADFPVRVYGLVQVPPEVPTLLSPLSGTTDEPASVTLGWSLSPHAVGYQCQLSTDSSFSTDIIVNDSTLTTDSLNITGLAGGTKYFWRVRSYNNGVYSEYSSEDTFTTKSLPPAVPLVISPVNNAANQPAVDTLICHKAIGALKYHWEVSTTLSFSSFIVNDSTIDTMRVVTLTGGQRYYWQVSAVNPTGPSAYAGPYSFTVMAPPAAVPQLFSPANNSANESADTLAMKWARVANASGYEVQLSTSPSFSRLVVTRDSTSDTAFVVTGLLNLQEYYWRVRAFNIGGATLFSSVDSFTTVIAAPPRPHLLLPFQQASVPRRVTFEWNASVSAVSYQLQVSTDNQFTIVLIDTSVTDTTVRLSAILEPNTEYYWRVSASNLGGSSSYSAVGGFTTGTGVDAINEATEVPKEFNLYQNYPNPFNPSTMIQYDVPKPSYVTVIVYDVTGREVATLVNGQQAAGRYSVQFSAISGSASGGDGSGIASGVYFLRMTAGSYVRTLKMILIK